MYGYASIVDEGAKEQSPVKSKEKSCRVYKTGTKVFRACKKKGQKYVHVHRKVFWNLH